MGGQGQGGSPTPGGPMSTYGVPFINAVPQNLLAPTYGKQIYDPAVGSRMGSGINPFFGPDAYTAGATGTGNLLSGQFGNYTPSAPPSGATGQGGNAQSSMHAAPPPPRPAAQNPRATPGLLIDARSFNPWLYTGTGLNRPYYNAQSMGTPAAQFNPTQYAGTGLNRPYYGR